jgi:flagellin
MDFVGTKAGLKGGAVVMGYLETGMRVLDGASALLARLQELAVLGANNTNTVADHGAINSEAEAMADEFNRLMTTSTYKGKNIFVTTAASEYVSMGGRNAEMTFGIGTVSYSELYGSSRSISDSGGPSDGATNVHLTHLPSDAVASKPVNVASIQTGVTYEITDVNNLDATSKGEIVTASNLTAAGQVVNGATFTATGNDAALTSSHSFNGRALFSAPGTTFVGLQIGSRYKIETLGNLSATAKATIVTNSDLNTGEVVVGATFTASANVAALNTNQNFTGEMLTHTAVLTTDIEAVQAKINTARVQAGSQYAAIESAVNYTTDLTAQYELGFNAVSDVNFSMETAHLAKNQILQQAATAMLAQANQGQQGLLQLIQG